LLLFDEKKLKKQKHAKHFIDYIVRLLINTIEARRSNSISIYFCWL